MAAHPWDSPPPVEVPLATLQANALIHAGQWWRLITPAFLHGGLSHLLVNMYSLNSLGPVVETTAG